MYVFFRLFKTIFFGFFEKKSEILDTSITPLRVWPNDIDYNLHLNNGRFLTLLDIGRMHLAIKTGLLKAMIKFRWTPIVGSAEIRYMKEIPLFAKFEIHTRVFAWDEKWFYMKQDFKVKNKTYATALVKAVFKASGKTVSPIDILEHMNLARDLQPEYDEQILAQFNLSIKGLTNAR